MPQRIYGIIDTKANDLAGVIQLHKHDAPAIRLFTDVAQMKNSQIARHPEDYELRCLGELTEDLQIIPENRVVITGRDWLATQQPNEEATQYHG